MFLHIAHTSWSRKKSQNLIFFRAANLAFIFWPLIAATIMLWEERSSFNFLRFTSAWILSGGKTLQSDLSRTGAVLSTKCSWKFFSKLPTSVATGISIALQGGRGWQLLQRVMGQPAWKGKGGQLDRSVQGSPQISFPHCQCRQPGLGSGLQPFDLQVHCPSPSLALASHPDTSLQRFPKQRRAIGRKHCRCNTSDRPELTIVAP